MATERMLFDAEMPLVRLFDCVRETCKCVSLDSKLWSLRLDFNGGSGNEVVLQKELQKAY